MFVLRYDGTCFMFAEGEGDIAHLLTSPDGVHWEEQGRLAIRSRSDDA